MRSPLMVISGSYELLLMEKDRFSQDQRQDMAMGQKSCRELIEIVTSLLDVSLMEAGQMPLNRVLCDIRNIAPKAVESLAVLTRTKALTLRVTGDSVSTDHGDRSRTRHSARIPPADFREVRSGRVPQGEQEVFDWAWSDLL